MPLESAERTAAYEEISWYLVEQPIHVPIAQYSTVHICQAAVVGCDRVIDVGLLDFRGVGIAGS